MDFNQRKPFRKVCGEGVHFSDSNRKKEVLSENCVCIAGFTQPQPFLELYRPLATTQDGFMDRILIGLIRPHLLDEEEALGRSKGRASRTKL